MLEGWDLTPLPSISAGVALKMPEAPNTPTRSKKLRHVVDERRNQRLIYHRAMSAADQTSHRDPSQRNLVVGIAPIGVGELRSYENRRVSAVAGAMNSIAPHARTPITVPIAIVLMLFVNLFADWGMQGPLTLVLVAVLALCVLLYVVAPSEGHSTRLEPRLVTHRGLPIVLWVWIAYAWGRLIFTDSPVAGLQNVAVQTIALLVIAVTASQSSADTIKVWLPRMFWSGVAAATIYLASVAATAPGSRIIYDARTYATVALSALCIGIALYATTRRRRYFFGTAVVFASVAASVSRTALATALVLLIFDALRHKGAKAVAVAVLRIGLVVAVAAWLIFNFEPLRERFEKNDGGAIFGIEVGTSGRTALWAVINENIASAPVWGHGPGNASATIGEYFSESIGHPHSEYLRMVNDYGWVGMILFGAGLVTLFVVSARALRNSGGFPRAAHIASMMAITVVAIMSATSNITIYVFAMVPLMTLVGLSLAHVPPVIRYRRKFAGRTRVKPYVSGLGESTGS